MVDQTQQGIITSTKNIQKTRFRNYQHLNKIAAKL